MDRLFKIVLEIANRLARDSAVQNWLVSKIPGLLPPFWRGGQKEIAAQLASGEIAQVTEDLRATIAGHVKEANALVEAYQNVQNIFRVSGITESTVHEAQSIIRKVNDLNIHITVEIKDPRKLKDVDLGPLRSLANAFGRLLRRTNYPNDINPIEDQLKRIEDEKTESVDEFRKQVETINRILTVLFLSADPVDIDSEKLRLPKEVREIEDALTYTKGRQKFVLENRGAMSLQDIPRYVLIVNPDIVHISAHGTLTGHLFLENELGKSVSLGPDILESIFQVHSGIHLVIINACHSSAQAQAIVKYIDYAIGMKGDISDEAAIAFSVGFYEAFGAGTMVRKAFDNGCLHIRLRNLGEHQIPSLYVRKD